MKELIDVCFMITKSILAENLWMIVVIILLNMTNGVLATIGERKFK